MHWSPLPPRAGGAGDKGVQIHGLGHGAMQHGSQESRQPQAAGWRGGSWEEVGHLSSVQPPAWGPSLGTQHDPAHTGVQIQALPDKAQQESSRSILTPPARAVRQMAARALLSSQTPYMAVLCSLMYNRNASSFRGPVGF